MDLRMKFIIKGKLDLQLHTIQHSVISHDFILLQPTKGTVKFTSGQIQIPYTFKEN